MATIPKHSESYTNPYSSFKQSFLDFSQQRQATLQGLTRSLDAVANYVSSQKKTQKELVAKQNETELKLYGQVEGFAKFGKDFNIRQEEFWDAKIDEYVDIKNQIEQGGDPREGNKKLAKIKTQLDNYKVISGQVLAIAREIKDNIKKEPGSNGAISSLVPTETQTILLNMLDGEDVGLVEEGGIFYLYQEGVGRVNVSELSLAETKEQGSYLKYIPDNWQETLTSASKMIYGDFDKGAFNLNMVTIKQVTKNGKEYDVRSIDENQKQAGIDSLINGNQLDSLLDNYDYMSVLWQDVVPDEAKGQYANTAWRDPAGLSADEAQTWMAEQKKIAKEYFAKKAVDDYIKEGGMTEGKVTGIREADKGDKPDINQRNIRAYYNVFDFDSNDIIGSLNKNLSSEDIAAVGEVQTGATINASLPQGAAPVKETDLFMVTPSGYINIGPPATSKRGTFKQMLRALGYSGGQINDITRNYKFD